jgi:alcohol dehydrogenase, propanol-preferring
MNPNLNPSIPPEMPAMLFEGVGQPLRLAQIPTPQPASGQVLLRVAACGVCHTDLHIVDGELAQPKLPLVLGHQIAGRVVALGAGVTRFQVGQRLGVPWLGYTDGDCRFCRKDQENLCDNARFTGYTLDGGFAGYAVADERYCFPLPETYNDTEAAPLLCAGLIGYRTYRMAGEGIERLGLYGFGAAAHIIAQVAVYRGQRVYAFTRPGDRTAQEFALSLGAAWAGSSTQAPPQPLDAALIFAPVGSLVVEALKHVVKGGVVVCGGIHMSDIPSFAYNLLWGERVVRSVANLTRLDGEEFLPLAAQAGVRIETRGFPLQQADQALDALRSGQLTGAAVLEMEGV